ncbi:MAG: alanine--tRNA ligase, partial [Gemmatimonadetes bacterium]
MKVAEIRQRFLDYFAARGHAVRPSSSLVPADDPTLLFTNAGMVQFKKVFLGLEKVPFTRAVTSQKCVRAGGKHNDLEEVGRTARHQTFFEMLGNFSFGDYFKREAIGFAWEFLTEELGMDPDRLYVTIHHSDDEAHALWQEVAGVPAERIFRLGDKDNFWQMADTGPCGPCSEIHFDRRPEAERGRVPSQEAFEEATERGDFLEFWNLVFMQFDRDEEGTLHPLPAPSIDTGAGLERLGALLQGVDSNYDTDIFLPLLEAVAETVGRPYPRDGEEGVSYRVLADHARAVGFLLADGVFPSNEGRGYVLRRILRRAVRHAWLLGRREPTLVHVVDAVIETMGDVYPELVERREHILSTTRGEEERFLATIEGGMSRFDELAPPRGDDAEAPAVIPGDEAFRLYDTFGFPLDLTQLMARERGYTVDEEGFERALEEQRRRSRADRARAQASFEGDESLEGWTVLDEEGVAEFVGYDDLEVETEVLAYHVGDGRAGLLLRRTPFYRESGGQVSDRGVVEGPGFTVRVDEVRATPRGNAVFGTLAGDPPRGGEGLAVHARVDADARRATQRNHTATHLLHAALREILGQHVVQRGSLVAPDRLRFDFAHTAPLTDEEREAIEARVNEGVWADHPVVVEHHAYDEAVAMGAMALFGEKYGDVVRVVQVPGVSIELCGGTHVRHTGDIGVFHITSESGVAAGVRRIEALTGEGAYRHFREREARLRELAALLGAQQPDAALTRARQLLEEKREVEALLEDLRASGGAGETVVAEAELSLNGTAAVYRGVRLRARDADDARSWGDRFLKDVGSGAAVVAADLPGDKHALFAFVTDDLIGRGVRASSHACSSLTPRPPRPVRPPRGRRPAAPPRCPTDPARPPGPCAGGRLPGRPRARPPHAPE